MYFYNVSAFVMESPTNESSSTLEQVIVTSDTVAGLEEICPKRLCISVSKYTSSIMPGPVTVAAGCTESATETSTLTHCHDTLSRASSSSSASQVSDEAVADVCSQSDGLPGNANCSEDHLGPHERVTAESVSSDSHHRAESVSTSNGDGSHRRSLRRKLSTVEALF